MSNAENDPRFKKVFSDPKYRYARKQKNRVEIDDRFSKSDLIVNKSTSKVDKYGRRLKKDDDALTKTFDDLYKQQGEESNDEEEKKNESESESDSESEDDEGSVEDILAKARGLTGDSDSDSDSDLDSDASALDDDEDDEIVETIPEHDPTMRFAAVNLDWDHLNSTDLFATFSSFLPKDGYIKRVQIFKSEYGKQKLEQEDLHGPPTEIFNQKEQQELSDEEDSDEEEIDVVSASKKLYKESNEEDMEFNTSELRKYQMDRLRYFYAVITFNSLETSQHVYQLCDSTEFESTGNFFDLRYIPDEMEFDDIDLRDQCNDVPINYKPIEFSTDALRSSKPKLTWDETPAERVQFINRAFKQSELEDMDFKAYLASDSEDENENEAAENSVNKYKSLVSGLVKNNSSKKSQVNSGDEIEVADGSDDDDDDVDIEFTFTPTTSVDNDEPKTKNSGEGETNIEKLKRKDKERKKARKERVKELKEEARNKKKRNNKNRNQEEQEPLVITGDVDGDEEEPNHFDQRDIDKLKKLEGKKRKNAKQKRREAELKERVGESNEKVIVDDRFKEMFEGHEFVGGSETVKELRKEYNQKKRSNVDNNSSDKKLNGLVEKIKRRKQK